jgi:hypothetical protein
MMIGLLVALRFFPKSFRPKPTKPDNPDINSIRIEQCKNNMKAESNIMNLHAVSGQKRIQEIDDEIMILISSMSSDGKVRDKIFEKWLKQKEDGETKALKEWEVNHIWHQKLPEHPELEDKTKEKPLSKVSTIVPAAASVNTETTPKTTANVPTSSTHPKTTNKSTSTSNFNNQQSHRSKSESRKHRKGGAKGPASLACNKVKVKPDSRGQSYQGQKKGPKKNQSNQNKNNQQDFHLGKPPTTKQKK